MKLIVFTEIGNESCDSQGDSISKLVGKSLLDNLTQEQKNSIEDEYSSTLATIPVERFVASSKHRPIMVNYYKVKTFPTVIFVSDNEAIYRWESKVPEAMEVITSIKNYLKILNLNIVDYNYDPED